MPTIFLPSLFLTVLSMIIIALPQAGAQEQAQPDAIWQQVDNYLAEVTKNGAIRWQPQSMPLYVFIKPGNTIAGYRPEFTPMLEKSFSLWADASQKHLSFVLTNDINKAQIICGWTSNKGDMTALTEGGNALVIPDGHNIKHVRITILTKTINDEPLSDQYFKRVALHEIGHACGLTNHSPNPDDIMYGTALSKTPSCTLTSRDKNTLVALYSIDQAKINHSALVIENMLPEKTNQSKLARILRLNADAAQAMQSKNLATAVAKLEEAHKLDAGNDLINTNLGAAYGNCAMVACVIQDNKQAQTYFDKALPLLSRSSNKQTYLSVLKLYENYLRINKRNNEEADKVANQIKVISRQQARH